MCREVSGTGPRQRQAPVTTQMLWEGAPVSQLTEATSCLEAE